LAHDGSTFSGVGASGKPGAVHLREEGHFFMGEAFVVPKAGTARLTTLIMEAAATVKSLDWRVHDIVIMPVQSLSQMKEDERSHRRETQA
ncbi:hypothetical protein, partial [Neoaquamicrobium sediminum]|uniref:hypothetical protein n=2 Tax=Neoaquamicrobium sediminum TaxID=1849104 RepID=UPI003610C1DF